MVSLPERRSYRQVGWGEWLLMTVAVLALVTLLQQTSLLVRTDRLLQDALVRMLPRDVSQSPVVLVGIDDKSIAALGRWPWPRTLHAGLIDRIAAGQPAAIGLDLLLSEADTRQPDNDRHLAQAMGHSGKVVLPMMMQNQAGGAVPVEPLPDFARQAATIGHVHLPVDEDGVARQVYLREGQPERQWNHFGLDVLQVGGYWSNTKPLPGSAHIEQGTIDPVSGQRLDWQRSHQINIAFAGPPGSFARYPYVDVLDGTVPPETFRGKLVLVGATATGIGDLYATPVTDAQRLMPGVEITANLVDALLKDLSPVLAPTWVNTLFNTLPVLLALSGLAFMPPLAGLLLCAGLTATMALVTVTSAVWFQVQLGPVAGVLGLVLSYVLWSWRRMDAATRYLVAEYRHFRDSGVTVPLPSRRRPGRGDFLDRRIEALTSVTHQLRDLHRFVSDSLNGLPDATLVCDTDQRIALANAAAARHFNVHLAEDLGGRSLNSLTDDLASRDGLPLQLAEHLRGAPLDTGSLEAHDRRGRDLLVKWAPSFSAGGIHTGWILSLVDVTRMRTEQRQRDDAMHFLSHDMRSPQSAILTLIDLLRQDPEAMTSAQFQDRIERHARKALALSDDFINLVRAQSRDYELEPYNLNDLLSEAMDDAWEPSQAKRIVLEFVGPHDLKESLVDRELFSRALANLVGNAIKYSPEGSRVRCGVQAQGTFWEVWIQDEGPGISREAQVHLFRPFYRVQQGIRTEGTGLGLPFVKTVAVRHGGQVTLSSDTGLGCRFALLLPRAETEPLAEAEAGAEPDNDGA
ncbi:MAG TPA: CHASE2 domain-containing protein [Burkholderiaceae bacterium]|nr:CHASE2 domain-containing protein [Burkholderiaceae bacterium]